MGEERVKDSNKIIPDNTVDNIVEVCEQIKFIKNKLLLLENDFKKFEKIMNDTVMCYENKCSYIEMFNDEVSEYRYSAKDILNMISKVREKTKLELEEKKGILEYLIKEENIKWKKNL